jgi:hypothetical protein
MQYMTMLYESPKAFADRTGPGAGPYWAAWGAYFAALKEAGIQTTGAALQPPSTGTTVRLKAGKRHVQDGPLAETKEQLGGYFIADYPSLDAAIEWAARCPAAADAGVEVRPVLPMNAG